MSAVPVTTITGARPMPGRWRAGRTKLAVAFVLLLLGAAAAAAIHDEITRPTMPQVVTDARTASTLPAASAASRVVDGLRFPNWTSRGWVPTGGTTAHLADGRVAATTSYTRGASTATYTIVSGTGNVHDEQLWPQARFARVDGRQIELLESSRYGGQVDALAVLKRHVQARTVVLTGSPSSERMVRELRRLALTDVPTDQRRAG